MKRRLRRAYRRWYRRRWPDGPEYVPPSEWWPVIGVCAFVIGVTQGGLAALFGVAGVLVLIAWAVRWVDYRRDGGQE